MQKFSPEYKNYLASEAWTRVRKSARVQAHYTCQSCRTRDRRAILQVHHLTYERLGHELPGDLQVLCKQCHEIVTASDRFMQPYNRYMRQATAWVERQLGRDTYYYDDNGQQDGITSAGLRLLDTYHDRFPFRG